MSSPAAWPPPSPAVPVSPAGGEPGAPEAADTRRARARAAMGRVGTTIKDASTKAGQSVGRAGKSAGRTVQTATGGAYRSVQARTIRLYDRSIDAVLATPHQLSSKDEALAMLSKEGDTEAVASQIQKLAIMLTPIVRRLAEARKIPGLKRVPFAASAITAASVGTAIRAGVRDVQVVGSYLAGRLEQASGQTADPRLVKKLTVDLYVHPSRRPRLDDRRIRVTGLLRTWLLKGALGRDVSKQAVKAVGAVAALDVAAVLHAWSIIPATAR